MSPGLRSARGRVRARASVPCTFHDRDWGAPSPCRNVTPSTQAGASPVKVRPLSRPTTRVGGSPATFHAASPGSCSAKSGTRKSVVEGKSVSVRVDLGGRRTIKKKQQSDHNNKKTKYST